MIEVKKNWCKQCYICKELCPKQVFGIDENGDITVERPDDCIKCRLCEMRCPDFAIKVED